MYTPLRHGLCLLAIAAFGTAEAATFTVTSTTDAVDASPGDGLCQTAAGDCTLRAAVQETNALAGADTIDVPAGTYVLTIAGAGEDASATGDLDVHGDLTIAGAGAASTVIDANLLDRVIEIGAVFGAAPEAIAVELLGLTLTGGRDVPNGGGLRANAEDVLVDLCVVEENTTLLAMFGGIFASFGGGISNDGAMSIVDSTVRDNLATNSSFDDVRLIGGGGIWNLGEMTVDRTTVSGNRAANNSQLGGGQVYGGGILNSNIFTQAATTVDAVNTTISGNIAEDPFANAFGGAITSFGGTVSLLNVTIAENVASNPPSGLDDVEALFGQSYDATNTIVDDNCSGTFLMLTSGGHNVEVGTLCNFTDPTDQQNTNALLGPLAANGGPTETHALMAMSPAINMGDNVVCPATDQRGVARSDGACDIGSYEVELVCTDADQDGFAVEGGLCGPVDCDDTNPAVHPGAVEIPLNGVDENCNGNDLCGSLPTAGREPAGAIALWGAMAIILGIAASRRRAR